MRFMPDPSLSSIGAYAPSIKLAPKLLTRLICYKTKYAVT